jgi:amino acid adenylation domain-containing protein
MTIERISNVGSELSHSELYATTKPLLSSKLSKEDHAQMLAWNATQTSYSRDLLVPQLVNVRARETPNAPAVIADGQVISYQNLQRRANQLAHYLRTIGSDSKTLVGICLPRSLDLVVGLLGILQAGYAYVPLDPAYPVDRKAFVLADAQISLLITSESLLSELPVQHTQVICLDRDAAVLRAQSAEDLVQIADITDRAYVIYTSGSTGQPKGVQVSHGNLLNLVSWHQRAYGITAADRSTQVTSPAFDATGWEIWPYLATGSSIYFPNEEVRVSPPALQAWLLEQKITLTFLPTILAESLLTLSWPATTPLRYLLTGADTLQHYPSPTLPFALVNNYGPTETTVVATYGIVPPDAGFDHLPSIGRPIDNAQIYLLDEHMQEVPIGTPGEIYIGGDGVAIGYLNRDELTSERFLPDPFTSQAGGRLYKTGDLAYYLPDGQIAFLGRADYQIKIRGYRIEPNEIITILNNQPGVQTSVVIARDNHLGEKQLVAYLVLDGANDVTAEELQTALGERLPEYMVPKIYVVLEALPSTSNGKVDRAALPEPDEENMLQNEVRVAPATPIEEQVSEIVATLLGLEYVSVEDNFFMLGGHSLLGTQVIRRVTETFGVNLTLRSLFDAPTVRLLSEKVEALILENLATMSEEEVQKLLG